MNILMALLMAFLPVASSFFRAAHFGRNRGLPSFQSTAIFSSSSPSQSPSSSSSSSSSSATIGYNRNNIDDQLLSCMSTNKQIKVTTCTTRNLLNDLQLIHETTTQTADALGQATASALLLSSGIQEEQIVQLNFKCNGPIRNIMAIADGKGGVRGYCGNPAASLPTTSEVVGFGGVVQVVKNHPEWKNPYNGITEMRTGEIDRDVGAYLAESEQRACALAASVAGDGMLCRAAGGYTVEQLPGADEETISIIERNLKKIFDENAGNAHRVPASLLLAGKTPLDLAEMILEGLGCEVLETKIPKIICDCSEERLVKAMRLLPRDDVDDILKQQEKVEAKCEFCGKVYRITPEEMIKRLESNSSEQ